MVSSQAATIAAIAAGLATGASGQGTLPFSARTYSADEDCRWTVESDALLPGNRWYIGGPPSSGERASWLASLRAYRRQIRDSVRSLRQAEINYRGVRAWTRMRPEPAKRLGLRPGQPFRIDIEARHLEGNPELVLALDLHSRQDDAKLGWSTVFSTLDVPTDGEWHRLAWQGKLPEFDHETAWVKLIVGMDATHDPTPGKVLVREFALHLPPESSAVARELLPDAPASGRLDLSIYDRPDLRWASRAFVCHFTFMYDRSFFDADRGEYTLDSFLQEAEDEFGGYDAVLLWQAYPRIGIDERNQFDFYRDMPGGLDGLRELIRRLHEREVRAFIAYNPWDRGTRREVVPDEDALADIVAAIDADGIFLDTMRAGGPELRQAVDARRPGVVFAPEGSPAIEQLEICSASWAQGLPELAAPGLLRLKWIEPRHMQYQINRWVASHARELENALFNGSGMLVWENIFGTFNPWTPEDRATLRRMIPVLRLFADQFASGEWEPMAPTLMPGVYANAWPAEGATVWTILNRTEREVIGPILRAPAEQDAHLFDLWRGERLRPRRIDGQIEVSARLGPLGCIAAVRDRALLSRVEELLPRQRAAAKARPQGDDAHTRRRSVTDPAPVRPSPRAPASQPPPGMVVVPAGSVTMDLQHMRRECGCYPDPGTPPDRHREFLWGAPHSGTIEHHIGPVELPGFLIDEHEVTNAEYARFLQESGYRPQESQNFLRHWGGPTPPAELADHPVVYVDLDDARAYTRWAGKRLPTELEWHRAAQGDDGRAWPWGNEFDSGRCNGDGDATAPVGSHPEGRSPFGCHDMAGNVWEWTESERSDGHTRFCILRGGSYFEAKGSIWYVPGGAQPCTSHAKFILMHPGLDRCSTVGFRCVKDVAPE